MSKAPFFSVCIPATNRAKTIRDTLESVANQSFKSYEVIITTRYCTDNTAAVINEFFSSELYRSNPFDYRYIEIKKDLAGTDDWNDPLLYAGGVYVAMLEGDDKFAINRLANAAEYLSNNTNCGILASGNQERQRGRRGRFSGPEYSKYIYKLIEVPPPSETIFRRLSRELKPYTFNTCEYSYAPEIDLYIRIANDGYDAYHDVDQTVFRDRSTSFLKGVGWKYFKDHFCILRKYKNNNTLVAFMMTTARLEWRMFKAFIKEASVKTELFRHLAVVKLIFPKLAKRSKSSGACPGCGGEIFLEYADQNDINFKMTADAFLWSKCENCDSLSIGPADKLNNLAKYYKNYAPHKTPLRKYKKNEMPYAFTRETIAEKFGPSGGVNIIDLGCGAGVTLYNLRKDFPNSKLFGLDVNIENAAHQLAESNVTLISGMLDAVNLKTKFDVIISSQFLEHLADPNEYKSFIENHANSEAIIILDVPNIESRSSKLFRDKWVHLDTPRHQWLPTRKGLSLLFGNYQNPEFQTFGSYMAYVSSLKLSMKLDIYSNSVFNNIITRLLQIFFLLIPNAWKDDKLIMSALYLRKARLEKAV
jgi:2-polyprenyl-3-methyl-5-hydroxy-6-metoxy-1,4-benzoquinol methylase/glycosyltransferase involved in cell wall biosynthesis